jgi:primosomal protein N' (replication factor Y) (superfamily II helicase)
MKPVTSSHESNLPPATPATKRILRVAVPTPLYGSFDYLIPAGVDPEQICPGCRVRVPFGRQQLVGLALELRSHSDYPASKLKPLLAVLDATPVLGSELLELLQWAASYYHHPLGEVINAALPAALREGRDNSPISLSSWQATVQADDAIITTLLKRAPKQQQLLQLLNQHPEGLDAEQLNALTDNWRNAMRALLEKNLVVEQQRSALAPALAENDSAPELNSEQQDSVDKIRADLGEHKIHLLHGITGSGKTEVYLALAEAVLAAGQQVLVLVPEISLTPQLSQRFQKRFPVPVAMLHSALNDSQRFAAWQACASGEARLLIGTRSAIFTPLPQLGLIVLDEEHDGSYKQQEGFRYNARDLALVRAHKADIPVVLGSATPSLESLHNVARQRYALHKLTQRAGNSRKVRIELMDLRKQKLEEGLSALLVDRVKQHLQNQGQVLLFLNRRGFAPLLLCHACGWTTQCARCDAHMTYHQHKQQLHCHHCGAETRAPLVCGDCGSSELVAIGAGTERIENHLRTLFPETTISRIDRDTTRRKGSLQEKLADAHSGESGILVGTQMLAKGHDFPNLTLVAVLDADQSLHSTDFRAAEHLAQLIIQVAGRAGRAEKPGEVIVQTHHPDHPLLQTLLHHGYEGFAEAALAEREQAALAPFSHLVMLRCEAMKQQAGDDFMRAARKLLGDIGTSELSIFGPVKAPMERRAGRFRSQIMLQASERKPLHRVLQHWLPQLQALKQVRAVRWSLDVDPYDTY